MALGFVVNMLRVRHGVTALNDIFTASIQGMTFRPLGVLTAFSPQMRYTGKTLRMASGGVLGTMLFRQIHNNLLSEEKK
jgi:hypothetical protein